MARRCLPLTDATGKVIGHVTVDVRNPSAPCDFCRSVTPKVHARLCDFPVHRGKDTKKYTCSLRLCDDCAHSANAEGTIDFCPVHTLLVRDNGLGPRLIPVLAQEGLDAHKVALDIVDEMLLITRPARPKIIPKIDRTVTPGWPSGRRLWMEYFSERAAIYEYLGEMSRAEAELRALADAGPRPRPA